MGERAADRGREVAAVRAALDMGYRLLDTAEMYGEGGAERVVGQAIAEAVAAGGVARDDLVVVSKAYPHHGSVDGLRDACRRSLDRLRLDRLDAYLLHWRGGVPLAETVEGLEALRRDGWISCWGVSNFDVADLDELMVAHPGATDVALNQVYLSLGCRGPEWALLPWHRKHGLLTMAYSPIDQGRLAADQVLAGIGARHGASAAQVALAWTIRQPGVVAIPKSVSTRRLRENLDAMGLTLEARDLAEIDAVFPPPTGKQPLAMI